jgi:uncharacterized membrane protein (DUF4010 family)
MNDALKPDLLMQFQKYGIALILGFLIGLEREKEKAGVFAGVRTFSLIALMGCLCAMIQGLLGGWFFSIAFAVVALFILATYRLTTHTEHPGATTETAVLLTFLFGALVWWDMKISAVALTVVTVLLLASKKPLVQLTEKIAREDVMAAIQFGLISAVILPILPDRTYGPFGVLNPYTIWLMVVLIAGFNLAAYAIIKAMGSRRGVEVMSVLGGLLSSTMLTINFSRRSRGASFMSGDFSTGLCLANTLMFPRILAILYVLNRDVGRLLLAPVAVATAIGLLCALVLWLRNKTRKTGNPEAVTLEVTNPFELWPAVQFGLLFAAVLIFSRAAQQSFGSLGVYVSGFAAGLASMDAITLSLANMANDAGITANTAAVGIVLATAGSMAAKCVIVAFTGGSEFKRNVLPALLVIMAAALGGVLMF